MDVLPRRRKSGLRRWKSLRRNRDDERAAVRPTNEVGFRSRRTTTIYTTYCSCSLRANGPRESVYHLHLVHKSSRQILLFLLLSLLLLLLLCARRRGGDAAEEKRPWFYMPDQISFECLWSTRYYSRISYTIEARALKLYLFTHIMRLPGGRHRVNDLLLYYYIHVRLDKAVHIY